jgi:subtilisin family serine protease
MAITPVLIFFILFLFLLLAIALAVLLFFLWFWNRERTDPYKPPTPHPDYPPEQFYIRNQLIVSGSAAVVDRLPSLVANQSRGVRLSELDRLNFAEGGFNLAERCSQLPADLVIVKYKIEGSQASVFRAVRVIDDAMETETGTVIKEPNWVIGQPYEIEGAPYEIEGAPYEIEGAGGGTQALDIDPDAFLQQWAFKMIGLPDARAKLNYAGEGIVVGVFDSAPYLVPPSQVNLLQSKSAPMHNDLSDLSLRVCRVFSPNEIAATPLADTVNTTDSTALRKSAVRNHGLFVSGLIHAIAPRSEKYLYRVLDSHNQGDLFLLLKGIYLFLRDIVASGEQTGAVINMSLVVRTPPGEANFGLSSDLLSLNTILEVADCLEVVAVSAAGNSSGNMSIPRPASYPGGMSGVFAIAANNTNMERSCFSNCGDASAPGGDGRSLADVEDTGCKPRIVECANEDCSATLIGPAIKIPFDDETATHYVLWSGSSFAAPLASGVAALVLETGQGAFKPALVKKLIQCSAITRDDYALGAGVIQIPAALEAGLRERPTQAAE